MRLTLIAIPFALLAACGDSSSEKASADNAVNAAAPEANAGNAMSAANTMAAMDPARADDFQACIDDVQPEVAPGTDLNAFCNCTVDRMTGMGEQERPAMEACAAQHGIVPNN